MWGRRSKRDQCDKLFSKYIRRKAKWRCEACGRNFENDKHGLQCSHFYSRGKESTRFDRDNCMALCISCHWKLGHTAGGNAEYERIMVKKLGKNGFDMLTLRAHTPKKKDRYLELIRIKELLNELDNQGTTE